ncbi:MAG: class I SAM-dependent methyltransferase [Oligoflexia bacterium]|nr:class I SAM-dependent methyltransferase [Oligoflexia bacterium]
MFNHINNKESIKGEQAAFDHQILDRINNGHIPDLRYPNRNEWFYNNVWRDPQFVKMSFLENINFLNKYLQPNSKILEVGCGPGHNSLELARNGHHVVSLDLSPECIKIANKTLVNNIYTENFGSLNYLCGDFLEMDIPNAPYDAVFFYGALSHFPDIDSVIDKVSNLLRSSGKILIYDTGVDVYNENDALIFFIIRSLLSLTGHYYENNCIPSDEKSLEQEINTILSYLRYTNNDGVNVQSPNDNSQTYNTMIPALAKKFEQDLFIPDCCFYRNIIGGIRSENKNKEYEIAAFIKLLDSYLTQRNRLSSAFFYYVGKKR